MGLIKITLGTKVSGEAEVDDVLNGDVPRSEVDVEIELTGSLSIAAYLLRNTILIWFSRSLMYLPGVCL